jgi:hypothetical protein
VASEPAYWEWAHIAPSKRAAFTHSVGPLLGGDRTREPQRFELRRFRQGSRCRCAGELAPGEDDLG